jgi:hypothetical protein
VSLSVISPSSSSLNNSVGGGGGGRGLIEQSVGCVERERNELVQHFVYCGRMSPLVSRDGLKVRLIDFPIPIRSSDCIGRYNRSMASSDFCIDR